MTRVLALVLLVACGVDAGDYLPTELPTGNTSGQLQTGDACPCAERGELLTTIRGKPELICGPPCIGAYCATLHSCHWQLP